MKEYRRTPESIAMRSMIIRNAFIPSEEYGVDIPVIDDLPPDMDGYEKAEDW